MEQASGRQSRLSSRLVFLFKITATIEAVLAARADVISGPILNTNDGGWQYSGLGFTALVNATLTAFTFENQGLADTVVLVDPLGNILDSVGIAAGITSDTVSVSWSLTAGSQYYLLQTTNSNSLYAIWGMAAPFDTQIALTDTGDFSQVLNSSGFGIGGGAGHGTDYWAAFNNITTTGGSSAPEPASLTLVLPAAVAVLWRARRKGTWRCAPPLPLLPGDKITCE